MYVNSEFIAIYTLGDIEEFPGLDPIPVYPVKVDPTTGEVEVTIKKNQMLSKNHGIQKPLCKASAENKEIVVIIGSGNHFYRTKRYS